MSFVFNQPVSNATVRHRVKPVGRIVKAVSVPYIHFAEIQGGSIGERVVDTMWGQQLKVGHSVIKRD